MKKKKKGKKRRQLYYLQSPLEAVEKVEDHIRSQAQLLITWQTQRRQQMFCLNSLSMTKSLALTAFFHDIDIELRSHALMHFNY